MTVVEQVSRTRRALIRIAVGATIIWAAAMLLALLRLQPLLAIAVALFVGAALLWRARGVWSMDRVALWIEERMPDLNYNVVTALEPRYAALSPRVEQRLRVIPLSKYIQTHARRRLTPALGALVVGIGINSWPETTSGKGERGGGKANYVDAANRLASITAEISPPGYSGRSHTTLREPRTITPLVGSSVALRGLSGYHHEFIVRDTTPRIVTLSDGGFIRLVLVNPEVDQLPLVTLRLPARDTTLRVIEGELALSADVTDDIGLARAQFEYIVSSGSGENFTFAEGTFPATVEPGATRASIAARVPYASLKLSEGDRLSVRAVAWDRNDVTGPGKGVSETRTIRIARRTEYEGPTILRAPPAADTALLSLRMLIQETDTLRKQRPTMARPAFVTQSRRLGGHAETIRRRIMGIVDETNGRDLNPDTLLTTALSAMWDATRELLAISPEDALPPLNVAYVALQKYRTIARYYFRGASLPTIVDVDAIRMQELPDSVMTGTRHPRPADRELEPLRRLFDQALRVASTNADSAARSLVMLRAASLRSMPALAAAADTAATLLQARRDARPALQRARSLLAGPRDKLDALPPWAGAWSVP